VVVTLACLTSEMRPNVLHVAETSLKRRLLMWRVYLWKNPLLALSL